MSGEIKNKPIVAEKTTFMQLINSKEIIRIPNYQREYAQGRPNRRAELIRTHLVEALYKTLNNNTNNEELELDFIFGGTTSEQNKEIDAASFNPVDGQQRLTILFLLHWYIFERAKNRRDLQKLKSKFHYATRTTSETFCKLICDEFNIKFEKDIKSIRDQIMNKSWFTGAMEHDPTVKSMLIVLDCIHDRFRNCPLEYSQLSDKLNDDDCPIYFFCLNMNTVLGNDSGIRDLYIKMNARGVPLTDFELFKADLQKKDSGDEKRLDLMAEYLGESDKADTRIRIIGKFNNEYTNFFFNLIDDGTVIPVQEESDSKEPKKQMFDVVMMNFINEIFRINYFCAISEFVSHRKYTNDNDSFKRMSGKEFTAFIESHGERLYKKYWYDEKTNKYDSIPAEVSGIVKESLIKSFHDIVMILDFFSDGDRSSKYLQTNEGKCCFSLKALIKRLSVDPHVDKSIPYADSLVRMALYDFIILSIKNSNLSVDTYRLWNRFIWKIYTNANADYKNFYEAIETLKGYRQLLAKSTNLSKDSLNYAIASIKVETNDGELSLTLDRQKVFASPAYRQLQEESLKAQLINENRDWESWLKKAENYYYTDGQLWFLLELSIQDDKHSIQRFEKGFYITKSIFDSSKHISEICSEEFERALLTLSDYADKDHLLHMGKYTTNTKKFVGTDFSKHISHQYCCSNDPIEVDRYVITTKLLKKMIDELSLNYSCDSISKWIKDLIDNGTSSVDWKYVFIKNDLLNKSIDGLVFKNGFEPNAWVEDDYSYIAVYTNEHKRTDSGELLSFALAVKCKNSGKTIKYLTSNEENYLNNGFPTRYFRITEADNTYDVGFKKSSFYKRTTSGEITEIGDWKTILDSPTISL